MNNLEFDPAYSAGVRNLLVTSATPARRRHHLPWTIGLSIAGLSLLGAGGAVAANYLLPGQDIVTVLDHPRTVNGTGTSRLNLGRAPAATNSIEFTIACSGGGKLTYPNGASQTCSGTSSSEDMAWTSSNGTFLVEAPTTASWTLTYHYSHRQPTNLGVNAEGQTYGVDGANHHPDLIVAIATNGRQGYINAKEEAAATCSDVNTPAEALKCNRDHEGKIITIPVYESDGITKIGQFQIG